MKEIIINKNNYTTYKDFYAQIYKDLDGKGNMDFEDYENLNYNPNMLDEFLWYNHNENLKFIVKNFDITELKQQKTYDDYEYRLVLEVIEDFVKKYPNNSIEFVNEDK